MALEGVGSGGGRVTSLAPRTNNSPALKLGRGSLASVVGGNRTSSASLNTPPNLDGGGSVDGGALGGGGGGIATQATQVAAPPPMSLDDFIKSNFLFTAEQNEGQRRLDDFDASTLRMQQETEADQEMRRQALGRRLDDAGVANAEDMAGRGLLRSGMTFQNQDKINETGIEQGNLIEQLLTNLLTDRGAGRVDQQAQNRSALNSRISQLTDQFNQKQLAPQGV